MHSLTFVFLGNANIIFKVFSDWSLSWTTVLQALITGYPSPHLLLQDIHFGRLPTVCYSTFPLWLSHFLEYFEKKKKQYKEKMLDDHVTTRKPLPVSRQNGRSSVGEGGNGLWTYCSEAGIWTSLCLLDSHTEEYTTHIPAHWQLRQLSGPVCTESSYHFFKFSDLS